MEQLAVGVLFIIAVIVITEIFTVPFSINKSEKHLKRIADALEKISKEGR